MFDYAGTCFVRHFEGGRAVSDDANPKAKIKINIPEMSPENVQGILLCEQDGTLLFFDAVEKNGETVLRPRFKGIDKIVCGNAWENMHTIKIGGLKKHLCLQLKVTHITPAEGGVFNVTLFALIERPGENFLEALAERSNREIPLLIVQTQDDPPVQEDIEEVIEKTKTKEVQADAFEEKPKRDKASKAKRDRKALQDVAEKLSS
jgi:hypothetical protein